MQSNIEAARLRIVNAVHAINCPAHLNAVETYIQKDTIYQEAELAIISKFGNDRNDNAKHLTNMLLDITGEFTHKIEFLKKIQNEGGIWDGNLLIDNQAGNIYTLCRTDPVLSKIAKTMATEFKGNLGYGPDQGPGEFLMAFTGKGVRLANKSDLIIGDKTVEIKAVKKGAGGSRAGGRLYSTSGYGSNSTTRKELCNFLLSKGFPLEVLSSYGWPNKDTYNPIGGFNLNASGLENLNTVFKKYSTKECTTEFFKIMLNGLYTEIEDKNMEPVFKTINKDGTFDPFLLSIALIQIAHDYYQGREGHDGIMIFNSDSGNYVSIRNSQEYIGHMVSQTITLTSHIDWHDDRSKGSAQLLIK